jgi:hypothetical protein
MVIEPATWHITTVLEKYAVDAAGHRPASPYDTVTVEGNILVYGGVSAIWDTLIGAGNVNVFDNTNAHIGVGNSSTAAAAAQTDLQGASKHYEPMDATYPVHTDGTGSGAASIVFRSTFETADANFAWQEFGIFNAVSGGRMLNRKVQSFGTKTSSDEWVLTITLTIS